MTERATGFINQTGNQQSGNGYHHGDEYQEYQEFGSYHGNSSDGNSNEHVGGTDHNNGYKTAGDGYPTMSNSDRRGNSSHYGNNDHYGNIEYQDNTDHYGDDPGDLYSKERYHENHNESSEHYFQVITKII